MVVPRMKTALITAAVSAVVVFVGYSLPTYRHLLAHQPGRDAIHPTSFPPYVAFFFGGYFAALAFVGVCVLFVIAYTARRLLRPRRLIQEASRTLHSG